MPIIEVRGGKMGCALPIVGSAHRADFMGVVVWTPPPTIG